MNRKKYLWKFSLWLLIVLIIMLISSGGVTLVKAEEESLTPLLISSFETEGEITKWKTNDVIIEWSSEHVTDGKYSAKVTFLSNPENQWPNVKLSYPDFPSKEWSKYKYIAFDLYNPNEEFFSPLIELQDSQGKGKTNFQPLLSPKSLTCVKIPLAVSLKQISDKQQFSFSDVNSLTLIINRWMNDAPVYIDNIRLLPSSPVPPKVLRPENGKEIVSPLSIESIAYFRRLRIFWMSGSKPGNESEFAKEFPVVEIIHKYQLSHFIGRPSSLEELRKYDLIIFDDVGVSDFNSKELEWVREFYRSGGGIVMIGGKASFAGTKENPGYMNTPIEEILPVEITSSVLSIGWPKFQVENPNHPIIKGLPWQTIPTSYFYNLVKTKSDALVLALDAETRNPLIVTGQRSLVLTFPDRQPSLVWPEAQLRAKSVAEWIRWENFIVQAFNYITRERETQKVVCSKVETSEIAVKGVEFKGKIYLVNTGTFPRNPLVEVKILTPALKKEVFRKEISSSEIGAKETKPLEFFLSLPENLPCGKYELVVALRERGELIDGFSEELILKPSLHLRISLPDLICYPEQGLNLKTIIGNSGTDEKVTLKLWLEKEGKLFRNMEEENILVGEKGEKVINHRIKLTSISRGKYSVVACLYKGEAVMDRVQDEVWIIPSAPPLSERKINYLWGGIVPNHNQLLSIDNLLSKDLSPFCEYGAFETQAASIITGVRPEEAQPVHTKEELIQVMKNLHALRVPFVIGSLCWWTGAIDYETLIKESREIIELANEFGKEYFLGYWPYENDAIQLGGYTIVSEKEKRLEKMDAYVRFMKKFKEDIKLPPSKLLITVLGSPCAYELDYEAGVDLVIQEAPHMLNNVDLTSSHLRGSARSFGKPWGMDIVRWGMEPAEYTTKPMPAINFDKETGRYSPTPQQVLIGHEWWKPKDMYKYYLKTYYSGGKFIRTETESPLDKEAKEMMIKFMDFVKENPRGEEVISAVGIVKSKGSYWKAPISSVWANPYGLGAAQWIFGELPLKEEADFYYLDLFFPDFALEDRISTKSFWSGSPYGSVDIIYPAMKLEDLKKYKSLIFIGYNRMDSVRADFLDDLMKYVEEGGTVILTVDQLRNSDDKISVAKLDKFIGVRLGSESFPGFLPKTKIKDYIEVMEETPLKLQKKRYQVSPEIKLYQEKEPWLYKVTLKKEAKVVAVDSQGIPVLLFNKYGKGSVFLFTTPTLSIVPPVGKSELVSEIIDRVAQFNGLPLSIFPGRNDVEFIISKTKDREATIFVMNHGQEDWSGDIVVNLKTSGLSPKIGEKVDAKIVTGYQVESITPEIKKEGDNLIIKGIRLSGDKEGFISFREPSFVYLRLK